MFVVRGEKVPENLYSPKHNVRTPSSKEAVLLDFTKKARYNLKDKESGEESPDNREEDSHSEAC